MSAVIVAGWIDWDPAHRDAALRHFATLAAASRAEAGCLDYTATPDVEDPARMRIFEHWTDRKHLVDHLELDHVQTFRAAVAGLNRTGRSLSLHVLTSSGPMTS